MKKTTKKSVPQASEVADEISKSLYFSSIKVMGKTYEAQGTTISEAISNLKPANCKGRGILTVQHGEAKKDRILTNVATFRLFNSHGMTKDIAIKNTANLFNGI